MKTKPLDRDDGQIFRILQPTIQELQRLVFKKYK